MDSNLYPRTHYIGKVSLDTIYRLTVLQLSCLTVLGIVKVSPAAILFPLFIAFLVLIQLIAGRYFTNKDLQALDAKRLPKKHPGNGTDTKHQVTFYKLSANYENSERCQWLSTAGLGACC